MHISPFAGRRSFVLALFWRADFEHWQQICGPHWIALIGFLSLGSSLWVALAGLPSLDRLARLPHCVATEATSVKQALFEIASIDRLGIGLTFGQQVAF